MNPPIDSEAMLLMSMNAAVKTATHILNSPKTTAANL